jgi:hypothetical protein
MLLFYDIINKPLAEKSLPSETCPYCLEKGRIKLTLYMRYCSMIIPFFGMGRPTGLDCTNCGYEIKSPNAPLFTKKNYSAAVSASIKEIKTNHKRTIWELTYPWSAFFLIFFLMIMTYLN